MLGAPRMPDLTNGAPLALPFRRCDVVDRDLNVVLSGPTPTELIPASGKLEPALAAEVRLLVNERRLRKGAVGLGLVGLDHAVRIVERPEVGPGFYLVSTERTALGGTFTRLVQCFALSGDEAELARLLIAGSGNSAIAIRLGIAPADAGRRTKRLLRKMSLRDRRALVELAFPRADLGRANRIVQPAEAN